jgi:hypothetical protein
MTDLERRDIEIDELRDVLELAVGIIRAFFLQALDDCSLPPEIAWQRYLWTAPQMQPIRRALDKKPHE